MKGMECNSLVSQREQIGLERRDEPWTEGSPFPRPSRKADVGRGTRGNYKAGYERSNLTTAGFSWK